VAFFNSADGIAYYIHDAIGRDATHTQT